MKIYVVFEGSSYPYASGNIVGVFLQEKDAEDMRRSFKSDESFYEEHEVIE